MVWELPVIALRSQVVFPGTVENVDVGRPKSKRALEEAQQGDHRVLVVLQRDPSTDDPQQNDLHDVGTLCVIKQAIRLPDDTIQLLLDARERVTIDAFHGGSAVRATVSTLESTAEEAVADELLNAAKGLFGDYVKQHKSLRLDTYHLEHVRGLKDGGVLADAIAKHATWSADDKQALLANLSPTERLQKVVEHLSNDLDRFSTDKRVSARVKQQMDANQREYYLREQMKAIQQELGNDDEDELEKLRQAVTERGLPEAALERANKEIDRLEKMPGGSPEATVVRTYLDTLLELPWSERDEETLDVAATATVLDEDHHALEDPKERILEHLAVRQLTAERNVSDYRAPILCFVGPPGVGKTSLGASIARSMNRKFVRMSLGGVRDEAEVRGHRRTYIGSMPGRILQGMKTAGTTNPVFLLDEIDKMTADFRGDPSSALLEVLDPEQNATFADHYLELPYNLSGVMFITTANSLGTIPRPLLDRMEIIQISGYTLDEKEAIARNYRIPKNVASHGLDGRMTWGRDAVRRVILDYTREAGVRELDRMIAKVSRKAAKQYLDEPWEGTWELGAQDVRRLLGVPPYREDQASKEPAIGRSHGLAWTSVGGVTLDVEAVSVPGSGKVALTGQLGEVMKESAQAAIAYLRANADTYGLPEGFYETRDVHVHVLEGAVPKDGPSAGIAIASAVASALTQTLLRGDVAMTGEITLQGRVLPIGGVKEKLLAAHQAGIPHVLIPHENQANLEDVPDAVLNDLTVTLVKDFAEVLTAVTDAGTEAYTAPEAPNQTAPGASV